MIDRGPEHDSVPPCAHEFATTRWNVVLSAGRSDSTQARDALAKLCQAYWCPLYAFVRRQLHSPHDAQDLTQEFFARLIEKNYLGNVSREKGRFRLFLLASLKHFLANERKRAQALKRGGGLRFSSLDQTEAAPTLRGRQRGVNSTWFAPDSRTLVTGSDDETVRFWNLATGQETVTIEDAFAVLLSLDGNTLVLQRHNRISLVRILALGEIEAAEKSKEQ